MKIRVLLICGFVLLISCQRSHEITVEQRETNSKINNKEASSYNTQLGLAYLKQGNRPRAKHKLLLAMAQDPNSPSVNASMGYYLEQSGEIAEAKRYYLKAISLSSADGAQLNNYGAFLCRQKQYHDAEKYFLQATRDPHYEHTAGAYENAGLCALAIPDYSKASLYFSKALEQDPSRRESLIEFIKIKLRYRQGEQALAYVHKYADQSLNDLTLLNLAIKAALQARKPAIAASYRMRLQQITPFSANSGVTTNDTLNS
ncbi:MAG: type IV pilus biogenesis/stability protein PilW [Legionella sp.]